ncbi:HAD hydrolase-like protein [Kitasatospora sp. NPDC047058]|uniref:HAD family hydrolase n=1 Tax=Kitasatospora sp. NPDC047058 TaxID=3155620 RepID=UPI0033F5182A
MSESVRPLVSLDIGGTLGNAQGPGLAARLAAISPLGPRQARRVMRDILHTAPEITDDVIKKVSAALGIEPTEFPTDLPVPPLVLFPGVVEALQQLSDWATVVTLSNVTCTEADPDRLLAFLSPWVTAHFPSCRIGFAKPDCRAFWTIADSYKVPAATMVHVGDDWECDIRGAAAAGVAAVWLSHGRAVPDEHVLVEHEVFVAHDLTDAVQHVRHLLDARNK